MTCVCGNREDHDTRRCEITEAARQRVIGVAARHGVTQTAALDLWAHARKALEATDASWVVSDVLDLGWRPCVTFHGPDLFGDETQEPQPTVALGMSEEQVDG